MESMVSDGYLESYLSPNRTKYEDSFVQSRQGLLLRHKIDQRRAIVLIKKQPQATIGRIW